MCLIFSKIKKKKKNIVFNLHWLRLFFCEVSFRGTDCAQFPSIFQCVLFNTPVFFERNALLRFRRWRYLQQCYSDAFPLVWNGRTVFLVIFPLSEPGFGC